MLMKTVVTLLLKMENLLLNYKMKQENIGYVNAEVTWILNDENIDEDKDDNITDNENSGNENDNGSTDNENSGNQNDNVPRGLSNF